MGWHTMWRTTRRGRKGKEDDMGGYDLYGQYYPQMADALAAEALQVNIINEAARAKESEALRAQVYQLERKIEELLKEKGG